MCRFLQTHNPTRHFFDNPILQDQIVQWINEKQVQHAVVAGAGFVGLEMVEQLVHRNLQVTLVEMMPQILGPMDEEMAAYLHRDLEERGVQVIVGDGIREFQPDPANPDVASLLKLQSGRVLPPAQLTILGLGVRPDTEVVKAAGIATTPRGHIVVDDYLHTNTDSVWAVGDAVEVNNPILPDGQKWGVPLAGPANRQGRMVADNILLPKEKRKTYKGTYAVSVVRSFDLYAACVGLNEKFLRSQKIAYQTVHIHPNSHAGYYPGAQQIHLKLIFDVTTGRIYGAQAVGQDGVEKRIDVIATALQGGLTVRDLAELELCYAPPVGSAKDPVNYAGMAAENIMDGLVSQVEWHELDALVKDPASAFLLDVRNKGEIERTGNIAEHAHNIPLNDLRSRLDEVPRDKKIVVSCMSGQRAYYACRILMQNGFADVVNVGGAYKTLQPTHPHELRN